MNSQKETKEEKNQKTKPNIKQNEQIAQITHILFFFSTIILKQPKNNCKQLQKPKSQEKVNTNIYKQKKPNRKMY